MQLWHAHIESCQLQVELGDLELNEHPELEPTALTLYNLEVHGYFLDIVILSS